MNTFNLTDSITIIVADEANVLCFVNLEAPNVVTLPTAKVPPNYDWAEVMRKEIRELLGSNLLISRTVHKITKIWLPNPSNETYIVNIVIWIKVSSGFKTYFVIPNMGRFSRLKWLNIRDLLRFYNLRVVGSPILLEIFPKLQIDLKGSYHNTYPSSIQEVGCYTELNDNVFNKDTGNEFIDEMIEKSPLKASRKLIYVNFLKLIYPDILMSGGNFLKVATKLGFSKQEGINLFRAADLTSRGFLTFNEYFGICVAMEPSAKHVGMCGKARATYIFRYLNKAGDGMLSLKELTEFIILVRKKRQLSVDAASLENDLKETATELNVSPTRSISLPDFIKRAEDLHFKGINDILRSTKSVTIVSALSAPIIKTRSKSIAKPTFMPPSIERSLKNNLQWEIATHSTRITNSCTEIMIEPIFNSDHFPLSELYAADITLSSRRESLENFSSKHVCNEIIEQTRTLAQVNSIRSGNRGRKFKEYLWGSVNPIIFAQKLLSVCSLAIDVFSNEPRLLNISSPVYILGDFHGNFGDLLFYEQMLWPLTPSYNPASVLFLGDYVDRGWYSIEIIAYLFASKVLFPTRFFLVRGNHEVREVQQMFTFFGECISKFGDQQGRLVWETINECFDYMPIAAIVDNQLFCCHGGIPPPWLCPSLDAINNIPKPLSHPNLKSPLAWDILWNDPIKDNDISREIQIELSANNGFALNQKRGTAHVFNCFATINFLKAHNLTHIIRAHELAHAGFYIFHKGKLISIFSTSKYNGNNNESACILAENNVLKIIRFVPSNINSSIH